MNLAFFQNFIMISTPQTVFVLLTLFVIFYLLKKMRDFKYNFSFRMFIALIVGLGFGFVLQFFADFPDKENAVLWFKEAKHYFSFFSSVFVAFIKMLVIPLVSVCIIKVIIEIGNKILQFCQGQTAV